MPQFFYPLAACREQASERRTEYATGEIHLFQSSFVPTPSDPLSSYTAAEADYDTYAPVTVTAWDDPILAPGSGFMISSPYFQFEVGATDPTTPNVIGGLWYEDAGGVIRFAIIFDEPLPMQAAYQAIYGTLVDLFPTLVSA